jgi:uracil-DNA glycosylase family 4
MEIGVDEAVSDVPVNRFLPSQEPSAQSAEAPARHAEDSQSFEPLLKALDKAVSESPRNTPLITPEKPLAIETAVETVAREMANNADSLQSLRQALEAFEGCALKKTATNLVFGDGNPDSGLMFVGEAPGADEDRQGKPFVGVSGRLLDEMLTYIGRDRSTFYITNHIYWRPPGNRTPSASEVAACLPFIQRHIELVNPRILVLVGGAAAKALLERTEGINKLRGQWFDYKTPLLTESIPATAIFHPAYLLRQPAHKRLAWRDLLALKQKLLKEQSIISNG